MINWPLIPLVLVLGGCVVLLPGCNPPGAKLIRTMEDCEQYAAVKDCDELFTHPEDSLNRKRKENFHELYR